MDKVNLTEKFAQFTGHYSPKIAGELNGQMVKLVNSRVPLYGIITIMKMNYSML